MQNYVLKPIITISRSATTVLTETEIKLFSKPKYVYCLLDNTVQNFATHYYSHELVYSH